MNTTKGFEHPGWVFHSLDSTIHLRCADDEAFKNELRVRTEAILALIPENIAGLSNDIDGFVQHSMRDLMRLIVNEDNQIRAMSGLLILLCTVYEWGIQKTQRGLAASWILVFLEPILAELCLDPKTIVPSLRPVAEVCFSATVPRYIIDRATADLQSSKWNIRVLMLCTGLLSDACCDDYHEPLGVQVVENMVGFPDIFWNNNLEILLAFISRIDKYISGLDQSIEKLRQMAPHYEPPRQSMILGLMALRDNKWCKPKADLDAHDCWTNPEKWDKLWELLTM